MQGHAFATSRLRLSRFHVKEAPLKCAHQSLNPTRIAPAPRHRRQVRIVSFGILKSLGFKKPAWLPDFGRSKRKAVLDRFFGPIDRATYEELLAPNFVVRQDYESRTYNRQGMVAHSQS